MIRSFKIVFALLLLFFVLNCNFQCLNECNFQGNCNSNQLCECNSNYFGPDCSLRVCPKGVAFFDIASGDDTAHATVECSGNGHCDHSKGECVCSPSFSGASCERMVCPNDCSGHGICMSMRDAGLYYDGMSLNHSSTSYSLWDADVIFGCVCDESFSGHDCSEQQCPSGIDPRDSVGSSETVELVCRCDDTCSGSFQLQFKVFDLVDLWKRKK